MKSFGDVRRSHRTSIAQVGQGSGNPPYTVIGTPGKRQALHGRLQ